MKSYSLIGVLGAGLTAILFGACTVTSTTNNNGTDGGSSSGAGDDSSTTDDGGGSSSGSSSGSTSSSGSSGSSGSSSGSSEASTDAGGTCSTQLSVGSATCDSCVQSNCCAQLTACDSVDGGGGPTDDAGLTECEGFLNCAITYAMTHPDSGVSTDDINTCAGITGDASATGGAATAVSLFSCVMTNCATQCQ